MPPRNVDDCNVYYSPTGAAGSYVELEDATGWAFTSDTDGETIVKTFGGGRYVRTGDDRDSYEISALFNPVAQADFRDAKRDKTSLWIALIWDDTAGAENGQIQECRITSYRHEAAADGDLARATFSALGEGALTEVTELPDAP